MDKARSIAKRGWHPEKDGKGLSSLLGRNNEPTYSSRNADRVTQPLSSLKDPSSFAPPPRSVNHPNYDPNVDGPAAGVGKKPAPAVPQRSSDYTPRRSADPAADDDDDDATTAREPSGPFRTNTTGLETRGLPAPPTRIIQRSETAPLSAEQPPSTARNGGAAARPVPLPPRATPATAAAAPAVAAPKPKPKPALPPRLPPRDLPAASAASPPPAAASLLNQGAVDRLAASGVSVPGLGIGGGRHDSHAAADAAPAPTLSGRVPGRDANVSELQARFARIRATEREQDEGSGVAAPTPTAGQRPPVPSRTVEEQRSGGQGNPTPGPPPVPLATKPRQ